MSIFQRHQVQVPAEAPAPTKVRYHYEHPQAVSNLAQGFCHLLEYYAVSPDKPLVIAGIGTDRSTGDSLGPLVGTFLSKFNYDLFHIYGTLDHPVHALNLEEKLNEIKAGHANTFMVAIDASLGRLDSVGMVTLAPGPVKPGAGVKKDLPEAGNIHFTGIVNVGGCMEFMVLQNTRLSLVMKMANNIATAIYYGHQLFLQH